MKANQNEDPSWYPQNYGKKRRKQRVRACSYKREKKLTNIENTIKTTCPSRCAQLQRSIKKHSTCVDCDPLVHPIICKSPSQLENVPPKKRGRGRPRKYPHLYDGSLSVNQLENVPPKRGRGRPRKYPLFVDKLNMELPSSSLQENISINSLMNVIKPMPRILNSELKNRMSPVKLIGLDANGERFVYHSANENLIKEESSSSLIHRFAFVRSYGGHCEDNTITTTTTTTAAADATNNNRPLPSFLTLAIGLAATKAQSMP